MTYTMELPRNDAGSSIKLKGRLTSELTKIIEEYTVICSL